MKRGQYIRLLLSSAANPDSVIAAAKQMALHGSGQTEESSTKDTTGDVQEFEITSQSYDISGSGLILTDSDARLTDAKSLNDFEQWVSNQLLYWRICVMNGENNRVIVSEIAHGIGKLTQLQMQGQVKQNATYNYTLTGDGALAVGVAPDIVTTGLTFPNEQSDFASNEYSIHFNSGFLEPEQLQYAMTWKYYVSGSSGDTAVAENRLENYAVCVYVNGVKKLTITYDSEETYVINGEEGTSPVWSSMTIE